MCRSIRARSSARVRWAPDWRSRAMRATTKGSATTVKARPVSHPPDGVSRRPSVTVVGTGSLCRRRRAVPAGGASPSGAVSATRRSGRGSVSIGRSYGTCSRSTRGRTGGWARVGSGRSSEAGDVPAAAHRLAHEGVDRVVDPAETSVTQSRRSRRIRSTPPWRVEELTAHELHAPWSWTSTTPVTTSALTQGQVAAVGLHRRAHEVDDRGEGGQPLTPLLVGDREPWSPGRPVVSAGVLGRPSSVLPRARTGTVRSGPLPPILPCRTPPPDTSTRRTR